LWQATGYAGTTKTHAGGSLENVKKRPERLLTIKFAADTNSAMVWNFKPQQKELYVSGTIILILTRFKGILVFFH